MSKPQLIQATRPVGRPPTGNAQSAAERMRRYRARQRAAGLRAVTRLESPVRTLLGGALKHRIIEARSLAMHCLAAQKIALAPALLDRVRRTLATWRSRYGKDTPRALDEWVARTPAPPSASAAVLRTCRDQLRSRRHRIPIHK